MFATEPSNSYTVELSGATYLSFNHLRLLVGLSMNALHEMERRRLGHLDFIVLPRWRASYKHARMLCCLSVLLGDCYSSLKCPKIIAPKELIAALKSYYLNERPYHLDSQCLKSKYSYNQSIDPNPMPNLEGEFEFIKQYREMNRLTKSHPQLEFIELPNEGESIDIGNVNLVCSQNVLSLVSVFGSVSISDGMPTTNELPIDSKQPQKFRKIDRKLPFMHLNFRTRKFSLERADSNNMYIIVAGGQPSLTLVLLMNNRIVLVDPCEGIVQQLSQLALNLDKLDSVIVTSARDCNSAGLFELMLLRARTNVITQFDIYERLVLLYRSAYMLSEENIRQRLNLKQITIGSPIPYRKLIFKFFVGFSIELCLFFTISYKQKSLVFYGNSIYDFDMIHQAKEKQIISRDRYKQLAELRWELHSAMFFNIFDGRRLESFGQLPEAIREKLCLNCWPRLPQYPRRYLNLFEQEWNCIQMQYDPTYNRSDVMLDLPFIDLLEVDAALELTSLFQETIAERGSKPLKTDPSKLYVVGSGKVTTAGRSYRKGDFFNVSAFLSESQTTPSVDIEAVEKSILLWINRADFNKIFTGQLRKQIVTSLSAVQGSLQRQSLFEKNKLSTDLSRRFLVMLEQVSVQKAYSSGQQVWDVDQPYSFCVFITKGTLMMTVNKVEQEIPAGYLIGDVYSLMLGRPHSTKVEVIKDSYLLVITKEALQKCFDAWPTELYYFLAKPRLFI